MRTTGTNGMGTNTRGANATGINASGARTCGAGRRRVLVLMLALVAALVVPIGGPPPVSAAPSSPGDEGGKTLREVFEAASKGHIEAKAKLDKSKKRQSDLTLQLKLVESRLANLNVELGEVAARSYRVGRLTPVTMLINSASPQDFLERAAEAEGAVVPLVDGGRLLRPHRRSHRGYRRYTPFLPRPARQLL